MKQCDLADIITKYEHAAMLLDIGYSPRADSYYPYEVDGDGAPVDGGPYDLFETREAAREYIDKINAIYAPDYFEGQRLSTAFNKIKEVTELSDEECGNILEALESGNISKVKELLENFKTIPVSYPEIVAVMGPVKADRKEKALTKAMEKARQASNAELIWYREALRKWHEEDPDKVPYYADITNRIECEIFYRFRAYLYEGTLPLNDNAERAENIAMDLMGTFGKRSDHPLNNNPYIEHSTEW